VLQYNDEMLRLEEAIDSLNRGVRPKAPEAQLPAEEQIPPEVLQALDAPAPTATPSFEDAPALSLAPLDKQLRQEQQKKAEMQQQRQPEQQPEQQQLEQQQL
jgi:hypothetical protein